MNMSSESEQRVEAANRAGGSPFVFVGYLLVIFILVSVSSSVQKSPTIDEPMHLFAGYSYLKWHDFRANPEHPPLAKMVASRTPGRAEAAPAGPRAGGQRTGRSKRAPPTTELPGNA